LRVHYGTFICGICSEHSQSYSTVTLTTRQLKPANVSPVHNNSRRLQN